jgi:hypothetical protein
MGTRAVFVVFCGLLLGSGVVSGQSITLEDPGCLPREHQAIVRVQMPAGTSQPGRLYFRWKHPEPFPWVPKDFYWVPLEIEPGGRYWTALPAPEAENKEVEIYAELLDGDGQVTARSETRLVKVTGDCPRASLTGKEWGVADNLTIGETVAHQQGQPIFGFSCGPVRINSQGIRRADESCRSCGIVD